MTHIEKLKNYLSAVSCKYDDGSMEEKIKAVVGDHCHLFKMNLYKMDDELTMGSEIDPDYHYTIMQLLRLLEIIEGHILADFNLKLMGDHNSD